MSWVLLALVVLLVLFLVGIYNRLVGARDRKSVV